MVKPTCRRTDANVPRFTTQIRRGRARVIGPVAQVGGQHGLGLGPGGHVRPAGLLTASCLSVGSLRISSIGRWLPGSAR